MTKTVIIGGVAAGASCAARLRRLDESAEIVMLEKGPYVSFANCGLPFRILWEESSGTGPISACRLRSSSGAGSGLT